MNNDLYVELSALLAEHTGVQLNQRNGPKREIRRYAHARGFLTVRAYLAHVRKNLEAEIPRLCDHGLVHLTSFGRDEKFWESLQWHFFGHILPGEPVRILSLGCSNGHELATVAVLAHQRTEAKNIELDAWDISSKCVQDAMNPTFAKRLVNKLPFVRAHAWKSLEEYRVGHVRLIPELVTRIHARVGDVRTRTGTWWGQEAGAYDLVLCRNLLMYLEASVVQDTYSVISEVLSKRRGGFLGIGKADPLPPHGLFQGLTPMLYCLGR